jgi:hypothetical protein
VPEGGALAGDERRRIFEAAGYAAEGDDQAVGLVNGHEFAIGIRGDHDDRLAGCNHLS